MTLILHMHPLASYCWKALIALHETGTPFENRIVDLGDPVSRAAFTRLWPVGKMPVLQDTARDAIVPEATIVIEYLAQHYPGGSTLLPADPDQAWRTRLADRFYDNYVHDPMQRIVADRLRPADKADPFGVEQFRAQIHQSYDVIEADMATKTWAMGDTFTLADCAAMPALYYANKVAGSDAHPNVAAYRERLMARPSVARVLAEAAPFFKYFPAREGDR